MTSLLAVISKSIMRSARVHHISAGTPDMQTRGGDSGQEWTIFPETRLSDPIGSSSWKTISVIFIGSLLTGLCSAAGSLWWSPVAAMACLATCCTALHLAVKAERLAINAKLNSESQNAQEQAAIQKGIQENVEATLRELDDITRVVSQSTDALSWNLRETQSLASIQRELAVAIGRRTAMTASGPPENESSDFIDLSETVSGMLARFAKANEETSRSALGLATVMQEIVNQVRRNVRVVSDIESICKQADVLAINATIEASRAGAAGRGFTVVAEAVRDLSARTRRFSATIRDDMRAIDELVRKSEAMLADLASQDVGFANKEQEYAVQAIRSIQFTCEQAGCDAEEIFKSAAAIDHNVGQAENALRASYTTLHLLDSARRRMNEAREQIVGFEYHGDGPSNMAMRLDRTQAPSSAALFDLK